MIDSTIVEEVHRVREQMLADFDGDLVTLVEDLQLKTAESVAAGRRVVVSPARATEIAEKESKKAG